MSESLNKSRARHNFAEGRFRISRNLLCGSADTSMAFFRRTLLSVRWPTQFRVHGGQHSSAIPAHAPAAAGLVPQAREASRSSE